jgi:hypothetical protein
MSRTAGWQPATISGPNDASAPEKGLKLPITTVEGAAEATSPSLIATRPAAKAQEREKLVTRRSLNIAFLLMEFPLSVLTM